MANYTKEDRYRHCILHVVSTLHGAITGREDSLNTCELEDLTDWLDWRIREGWLPSIFIGPDREEPLHTKRQSGTLLIVPQ